MKFVILIPSGISGFCVLGEGQTEKLAWEDAYGPKPWDEFAARNAKKASCREMTDDELEEFKEASRNR